MKRLLTRQQRAFLNAVKSAYIWDVLELIGPNHPTLKWWKRKTKNLDPTDVKAHAEAQRILNEDAQL